MTPEPRIMSAGELRAYATPSEAKWADFDELWHREHSVKTEGPFCVDCKHYGRLVCRRSEPTRDIVTGEPERMLLDCRNERLGLRAGSCGPEGKYFTPSKPTGWQRIRSWLAASLGLLALAGCSNESRQLIAVTDTITGCQYVIAVADPGYNNAMVNPIKGTCNADVR